MKIKSLLKVFKSRFEQKEESISEHKNKKMEIVKYKKQTNKKRTKKSEQHLQDLRDIIKWTNARTAEVPTVGQREYLQR